MFEKKIKPILSYVGSIGAGLTSIAYIIVMLVLIQGISFQSDMKEKILYTIINAIVGFMITIFLRMQGIQFARDKHKDLLDKVYGSNLKKVKLHSIKWYWLTSIIKDIFSKVITIGATTFGIIYICIQGSKDYTLILLAIVNLLMFLSFGVIALNKGYEFYDTEYVAYLNNLLEVNNDKVR